MRNILFPAPPVTFTPSKLDIEAQKQIDSIVAASKNGTLGNKMLRSRSEFPKVALLKVLITDNALEHSNPNEAVTRKPSDWLDVFYATRKWLVKVAFYLASLGDTPEFAEVLHEVRTQVSPHFDTLYKVVLQAKEDLIKGPHDGLESEYRAAGKFDILEMAFQLRCAELAAQDGMPIL